VRENLPPGPRMPALLQSWAAWSRPTAFIERCRARHGTPFTLRLVGQPPAVMISDPQAIRELFLAAPEVLHPGEGARILEPIVGRHSVILLDEDAHMEQRKLLLPAFHGERMQRLGGLMSELTERELAGWPRGQAIELHPLLQRLTLEIILRAVFGLQRGAQLDALREQLSRILAFSESPLSLLPPPPRAIARFTPMARFEALSRQVDELIFALVEERRRDGAGGEDVLALLLGATHEDGSPMSPAELRDELMTALVAGHETTASQLAWAFERLTREPRVQALIREEADEGAGEEYLTATVNEILRHRPVLQFAEPRYVKQPVQIGGVHYPRGVALLANSYLLHHDPAIYPDPYAFLPERFLEQAPGTYTWIPFGGGRRRCIGASFALLEMKIAIRTVLSRCQVSAGGRAPEGTRRRSITVSPARGGRVILSDRAGQHPRAAYAQSSSGDPARHQVAAGA
jgi:cytochrome P450